MFYIILNALRSVVLRDVVYPCNTTLCFWWTGLRKVREKYHIYIYQWSYRVIKEICIKYNIWNYSWYTAPLTLCNNQSVWTNVSIVSLPVLWFGTLAQSHLVKRNSSFVRSSCIFLLSVAVPRFIQLPSKHWMFLHFCHKELSQRLHICINS